MLDDTVIELRQYTLFGGKRDTLVNLFEAQFIAPQNAVGAHVIGTFRDPDDPDRFVWLRGFADMTVRKQALETFYSGPVWKEHRAAAVATMIDSDNVLLLRPVGPAGGFGQWRSAARSSGAYAARIYSLGDVPAERFADFFEKAMRPRLADLAVDRIAAFATEPALNTFPALPVRGERVFVWFGRWTDQAAERTFDEAFARESGWRDAAAAEILPALMRKPERLRLAPTARSPLR